jgi:RHS repeat-associated protein
VTQRDGGNGDVFAYDYADQVDAVSLNVANPDTTPPPSQNITYDANGNRTEFHPYGTRETYAINNLNQYSNRTIGNVTSNAAYDADGNMTASPDSGAAQLSCTYDAQNRLLTASKGQTTITFACDGLNRQVKRSVTGQPDTFSVWDGWDLVEEYQPGSANATAAYVYGGSDLIAGTYNGQVYYYYHDASGSTSHLADSTGHLVEWYRYDLQGTPSFYDQDNNQRNPNQTAYGVRHLFTGQQWYQELGLYNLRNRFYSPDLGRFLQPDPIGFWGDQSNLYRYCHNNPPRWRDPSGLQTAVIPIEVTGQPIYDDFTPQPFGHDREIGPGLESLGGGGGGGGGEPGGRELREREMGLDKGKNGSRNSSTNPANPPQQNPTPSQSPPTPTPSATMSRANALSGIAKTAIETGTAYGVFGALTGDLFLVGAGGVIVLAGGGIDLYLWLQEPKEH